MEGCFQLFKGLLETFCSGACIRLVVDELPIMIWGVLSLLTTVGDYHVFEFSDYLWALLISQSKVSFTFFHQFNTVLSSIVVRHMWR